VEDYSQNRDNGEETEPYRVERISTVLAVTCMFLSALYTIFAVLLFLCYASETILSEGHHNHRDDHHDHRENGIKVLPLVPVNTGDQHQHQRHTMDNNPGFITMDGSSYGERETNST
jgi:hypothetical protein